jgi:hypothetical protein
MPGKTRTTGTGGSPVVSANASWQELRGILRGAEVTGPGANEVELLWPSTNAWPPEIDFNETNGALSSTTSSDHFGATNIVILRSVTIDRTQGHPWG